MIVYYVEDIQVDNHLSGTTDYKICKILSVYIKSQVDGKVHLISFEKAKIKSSKAVSEYFGTWTNLSSPYLYRWDTMWSQEQ